MNRFLSQDDSNNSGDLSVRTVTVDTSAVTDALTLRADTLETSAAALLEYIRILEDVSYTNTAFNAYTEAARRKIASDMPYPSYVQISTTSSQGIIIFIDIYSHLERLRRFGVFCSCIN